MSSPAEVALVTGSSRGIGLQIARTLGHHGHAVVLVGRDAATLQARQLELTNEGVRCAFVAVDLREPAAAERAVAAATAALGQPTVLVNNAGTAPTAKAEATTDAMLDETLDLHVRAPLRLCRALLPTMRSNNRGCLLQLASTAGLRGFPFTLAYTAAKHAMVGVARALAAELQATSIRSYAVCPGFVDTDITRTAAAAIAARSKLTAEEAFRRMAAQNRIGRMHTTAAVADAVLRLVIERPAGCVFELDREPPAFVD